VLHTNAHTLTLTLTHTLLTHTHSLSLSLSLTHAVPETELSFFAKEAYLKYKENPVHVW
jgi:hypothetical protein